MKMKIYLYIITLIWNVGLFAQNENNSQSIELPAFVITGIQSVSIPTMDKKKTDFIPVVGQNFLTPNYDTEDFSLMNNSAPLKKEMKVFPVVRKYNGLLQIGIGTQTLPIGNMYFGFNRKNFIFNSHIYGSDVTEYVPYAGYNTSGAKVRLNYFVNHKAKYFPGLSVGLVGDFKRDQYNYYGTSTPSKFRENEMYNGNLYFSNRLDKKFQYGIDFGSEALNMKEDGTVEDILTVKGFAEYKFGAVNIGGTGNYKIQKINDDISGYSRADYYGGTVYLNFANSKTFGFKIGAHYSQLYDESIVSPMVLLSIFVEEGAVLFISYEGNSELVTLHSFMKENRFFEKDINNLFQKKYSNIKTVVKYDFSDVFEINAGFHSAMYDNYHYYEDFNNDNRFNIAVIDDVKEMGGFINVIINTKKYGELFANFEFQDIADSNGNKIPYKPMLIGDFSYGYLFNFGLYSKIKFQYSRYSYTNLKNTQRTSNYLNIGLFLKYNFFNNLALTCDFQNLLNREDYLLKGYQEKPLDVIVGIEYRW